MSTNGTPNGTGHGGTTPPEVTAYAGVPNCLVCGEPAVKTLLSSQLKESILLALGLCPAHLVEGEAAEFHCLDMAYAALCILREKGERA